MRDLIVAQLPQARVSSSWIDRSSDDIVYNDETIDKQWHMFTSSANRDILDLRHADTLISFTGGRGRGGRHVEFGVAVALAKRLVVIGPREHIFHTLDQVEIFSDIHSFLHYEDSASGK